MILLIGDEPKDLRGPYKVLEIRNNVYSITYAECWKGEEYDLECACKKFNLEEAKELASRIHAELMLITPISFIYPWGPLTIVHVPVKEILIRIPLKTEEAKEVCKEALLARGDFFTKYIYPISCEEIISKFDTIKEKWGFGNLTLERKDNLIIIKLSESIDYCEAIDKLQKE